MLSVLKLMHLWVLLLVEYEMALMNVTDMNAVACTLGILLTGRR